MRGWAERVHRRPTGSRTLSGTARSLRQRLFANPLRMRSNTNLHILMNWQKQGADWKLLFRAPTKL
jgi:hypothetical protein